MSDQSEACVLSSHVCQIPEIFAKLETENEPGTFVRTRKECDSGKNVVTIPKLTTSQSMKKEAHFQHWGWADIEIQLEGKNVSPHYEA